MWKCQRAHAWIEIVFSRNCRVECHYLANCDIERGIVCLSLRWVSDQRRTLPQLRSDLRFHSGSAGWSRARPQRASSAWPALNSAEYVHVMSLRIRIRSSKKLQTKIGLSHFFWFWKSLTSIDMFTIVSKRKVILFPFILTVFEYYDDKCIAI